MNKMYTNMMISLGILMISNPCFSQTQLVKNLSNGIAQTVLCLGTSNYINATPFAGGTWVPQVEDRLNELYSGTATMVQVGASGGNSASGATLMAGLLDAYDPDVVVMGFAIGDDPWPETRGYIESMVADVRAHNADAEIIFFNIISPEDVPGYPSRTNRPNHQASLELWDTIAREQGLLHINLYDEWEALRVNDNATYLSYTTEGVHMNPAGNLAITTPGFIEGITIPEPATMTLLGIGALALLRRKRL